MRFFRKIRPDRQSDDTIDADLTHPGLAGFRDDGGLISQVNGEFSQDKDGVSRCFYRLSNLIFQFTEKASLQTGGFAGKPRWWRARDALESRLWSVMCP